MREKKRRKSVVLNLHSLVESFLIREIKRKREGGNHKRSQSANRANHAFIFMDSFKIFRFRVDFFFLGVQKKKRRVLLCSFLSFFCCQREGTKEQ